MDAFAASLAADLTLWVARGQCLDHHGMGEAYLPVLDALGRLCRRADGGHLVELLDRYAPTWLAQMPPPSARAGETVKPWDLSASPKRMLREFADAVEAFTADRLLLLILEDLHCAIMPHWT